MDPVSAIGLASSILTFVEFAATLVTGSVRIYRSLDGALGENKQLDKVIDELDSLSVLLEKRPICETGAERKIARIARDCRADSKKLEDILRHIASPKNKGDVWRSLKAGWMSIRSRGDVTELRSRLQEYRSEVLLQLSLLLREEQSSLSLGIAKIRDDCSQLKIEFRTDIIRTQDKILESISALDDPVQRRNTSETPLADISKMLLAIQTEVDETQLHHRILRQLVFKDMNSRANQVHRAAQDTYTWMLEDGPVKEWDQRSHAWHNFLKWLRTGDNIFFVSGNPGSGKSTLMKFLIQHERTKEELAVWSGKNTLILCVFYFWNSGSATQRTLSGLYRSLLFQSLSQQPRLMEEVFPVQFRRMRTVTGDLTVEGLQNFDEEHIEEAFNLLLHRASHGGYRLCFFIDGLDEFEGNRLKHEELALMLQRWTVSGAIKLCVSSRPYLEFIEPLSIPKSRMIHLHELNESDIRAYCINRFANDIHARGKGTLCKDLADSIVRQAQGVFLWVYLVIDILLIGLRQADPDSVLWAQLHALPSDLDLLYTKLREPIEADSIQRDRSNRMLLLAAYNPCRESLPTVVFSWLEEEGCDQKGLMDPDFPPSSEVKPYSKQEFLERVTKATKQINGLARGFLEVFPNDFLLKKEGTRRISASTVEFCHRTARDYLLHDEDRRSGLLRSFPDFDKSGVYTRIRLAEIIHGCRPEISYDRSVFSHFSRSFCRDIDPDLVRKFELPTRSLLTPFLEFLPSSAWPNHKLLTHPLERISFTEYAAYCGLNRFVLREVATDATKLSDTSSYGNVLVAAVNGRHCSLTSELLKLSRGKTQLCEVFDEHGKVQSLVPACVLAIAKILEGIIGAPGGTNRALIPSAGFLVGELTLAKELLRFSVTAKIALRITVSFGGLKELQVQIDAAEAMKLFESPKTSGGVRGMNSEAMLRGNRGQELFEWMNVERLGRLVDKETGTARRLKEWPEEPHAVYTGIRGAYVDRIEWSLENEDLMELKGWVRLY